MGCGYHHEHPFSLKNISPSKIPDFAPELGCVELVNGAKLTDFISSVMINYGFVINDKVKSILEKFKLPKKHIFFPLPISYNASIYGNYYWFLYVSDQTSFIDYSKTEFFVSNLIDEKIKDVRINSRNELLNMLDVIDMGMKVRASKICFDDSFNNTHDLFEISKIDTNTYISEQLANVFIQEEIQGITLTERIFN
jgi:hypothetical protein